MRASSLMSCAAAVVLVASPAFVSAQDLKGSATPTPAPAPGRAPAERVAPPVQPNEGPRSSNPSFGQTRDAPSATTGQGSTPGTTGQGAAGTSANLTSEQRTTIGTAIRQQNVRPVTNVNFTLAIGANVPRDIDLHPLPVSVIELYPAWRGYHFVLAGDEIVVIDPATFRIVAIIEA